LPFHVTGFWPAFWGAIIVGLVSWLLYLPIGDNRPQDKTAAACSRSPSSLAPRLAA